MFTVLLQQLIEQAMLPTSRSPCSTDTADRSYSIYCVFDGHNGKDAARHAKNTLTQVDYMLHSMQPASCFCTEIIRLTWPVCRLCMTGFQLGLSPVRAQSAGRPGAKRCRAPWLECLPSSTSPTHA